MEDKFLVINAGSSSLKFSLYEMPEEKEIINGIIERIGLNNSSYKFKYNNNKYENNCYSPSHNEAVSIMIDNLLKCGAINNINEIKGIGHRILHGGEIYSNSVVIDTDVFNDIVKLTKLAPLHHPGEISGIKAMANYLPEVPMVAVFDTAFHQTIPENNYMYATPYEWYEKYGIRKYGFHGTSHNYITQVMKEKLTKENINLIICHIGSGASITAIKEGKSYNTTMGLTPLDGLVMGTRCGSIDPSIIEYISKETNKSLNEITSILNEKSGFLGICGKSDNRDVELLASQGNKQAILALNLIEDSIVKYIAQYYFALEGNIDGIVFTAGIGENSSGLREDVINKISKPLDIKLNKKVNNEIAKFKSIQSGIITTNDSSIKVYVIPTNEELIILRDTYNLINKKEKKKVLKK